MELYLPKNLLVPGFLIFWQSFKNIGSIEQSSEPQKIPDLCFAQNLIETYNMSVVIYVSQLLV